MENFFCRDKLCFMTRENITHPEKKTIWQRLTEPHPSIEDFAERRFASVLATLLLALLPLYFLPEGIRAILERHPFQDILHFIVGTLALLVAYWLARGPRPRLGAALTMIYFTLIPFLSLVTYADRYVGDNVKDALIWSVPIMLMALILLHPRDVKWVVFLQIALFLIIPAVWNRLSYEQVFSTLWLVIAVGGLMIVSAFVQERYLRRAFYEAEQTKKNQERFRDLFLTSPVALLEADYSAIKSRLDQIAAEHDNVKSYILAHPESMVGAGSSVRLLDANLRAQELYEAESRAALLDGLYLAVSPREMLALRDGVIALWEGTANHPIETIHHTMQGREKNVVVRFSIRSGYEDTWEYVNISVNDVTERRAAEASVRQLASAVEASASSIVITDKDGAIEYVNPAAAQITGYQAEELIGQTPNILKSGMHDDAFYEDLWQTIERGDTWRGELINRRKDGSLYWESQTITPVHDEGGAITNYVAIKEDITRQREIDDQLRYLSSATEQAASGIVITDAEGKIEYTNAAFTNVSGFSTDDVFGNTLEVQRSGEHPQAFYDDMDDTITRGEVWKGEIINLRKDGSQYWESMVVSPIRNKDNQITHRVYVKEDITLRKGLEQALALAHEEALVASDMKTQLLANVSHDMRTPLGAILGYTEMLREGVFDPLSEGQDKAMRTISSSAQRLLDFVNNLLSQAQIDTGKLVLNQALFSPEKLLTAMGGELSFAHSKGIEVETRICENLPAEIEGDAYWLGQILHNLVSNSIKFTPEGGKIKITLCREDEAHWSLSVSDTGKGIPPEAQEYIFDSFRQVDGSAQREVHTGSGLGLSIVKDLVRLMNGTISLESELDKGSTFTITLPL